MHKATPLQYNLVSDWEFWVEEKIEKKCAEPELSISMPLKMFSTDVTTKVLQIIISGALPIMLS